MYHITFCSFGIAFLASKDTCKKTVMGKEYRGKMSETISGRNCQDWTSKSPHFHINFGKGHGLEKNYCRNPDGEPNGPWCYTTDRNKRWEYCPVSFCKVGKEALSAHYFESF